MRGGGAGAFFRLRHAAGTLLLALAALGPGAAPVRAQDPAAWLAALEKRYAAVETATGEFQQTYRAPGVDQVESGSTESIWRHDPLSFRRHSVFLV